MWIAGLLLGGVIAFLRGLTRLAICWIIFLGVIPFASAKELNPVSKEFSIKSKICVSWFLKRIIVKDSAVDIQLAVFSRRNILYVLGREWYIRLDRDPKRLGRPQSGMSLGMVNEQKLLFFGSLRGQYSVSYTHLDVYKRQT